VLELVLGVGNVFSVLVDVEVALAQWHVLQRRDYTKKRSMKGSSKATKQGRLSRKEVKSDSTERCRFRCKTSKACEFGLNLIRRNAAEPWNVTLSTLQHTCEHEEPKKGKSHGPLRKEVAVKLLQPHIDADINMPLTQCKEILEQAMGGPFRHSDSLWQGARRGCVEQVYARLARPFRQLESFGLEVRAVDKDNDFIVEYELSPAGERRYRRCLMAIGPMRRLLHGGGVRTVLSISSVAVGSPVFQGYILCMSFSDVSNRVAPMFVAHVLDAGDVENYAWFLAKCIDLEPKFDSEEFACVIGCPDVYAQVSAVLTSQTKIQPLRCCAAFAQNVEEAAVDKLSAVDHFFEAARTLRPFEFAQVMGSWEEMDPRASAAAQKTPPEQWCNAYISACRVGMPGVISSELGSTGYLELLESLARLPLLDVLAQLYSYAVEELVDRHRLYKALFLSGDTRPPFATKLLEESHEYVRTCIARITDFKGDHIVISHTDGLTQVDRLPCIRCHRCGVQQVFGIPCWHEVLACASWGVDSRSVIHAELDITATLRALVSVDKIHRLPSDLGSRLIEQNVSPPRLLEGHNKRSHCLAVNGKKVCLGRWGKMVRVMPCYPDPGSRQRAAALRPVTMLPPIQAMPRREEPRRYVEAYFATPVTAHYPLPGAQPTRQAAGDEDSVFAQGVTTAYGQESAVGAKRMHSWDTQRPSAPKRKADGASSAEAYPPAPYLGTTMRPDGSILPSLLSMTDGITDAITNADLGPSGGASQSDGELRASVEQLCDLALQVGS